MLGVREPGRHGAHRKGKNCDHICHHLVVLLLVLPGGGDGDGTWHQPLRKAGGECEGSLGMLCESRTSLHAPRPASSSVLPSRAPGGPKKGVGHFQVQNVSHLEPMATSEANPSSPGGQCSGLGSFDALPLSPPILPFPEGPSCVQLTPCWTNPSFFPS